MALLYIVTRNNIGATMELISEELVKDARFKGKRYMYKSSLLIGIGLLAAAGFLYGGLVGSRSLLELEQNADLIIVGSASADISVGSTNTTFPVQISRVIKGDATITGTYISVTWTAASGLLTSIIAPRGTHFSDGGTGLWFLQRSQNGWLLLPVMTGGITFRETYFPVPAGPIATAYAYSSAAALSDRITSELAAALETDHPHSISLESVTYSLDKLDSPVLQVFYQRMAASSSMQQRILGLSGLIRRGSAIALTSAASIASQSEQHPGENGILLNSIRYEFRATDANSIAALGHAAVDSINLTLDFRQAAAHALASIHTIEALPYLATLLDDVDEKLRIEAIGGCGAFANGLQIQTTDNTPSLTSLQLSGNAPYRTAETIANFAQGERAILRNEAAYLSFWKDWWTSHRKQLGY
jgi:hypothetical protein